MSRPSTRPPQWLMCILMLCLSALLVAWLAHPAGPLTIRAMPEVPTPTAAPTPAPAPYPSQEPDPAPDAAEGGPPHHTTGPFPYTGTCPRARLLPPRPRRGGRGGGMVR